MAAKLLKEIESKQLQLAEYQKRLIALQSQQVQESSVVTSTSNFVPSSPVELSSRQQLLERNTEVACLEHLVSWIKSQLHGLEGELLVYGKESRMAERRIEKAVSNYNDCREEMLLAWHQLREAIASDPLQKSVMIADSDIQLPLGLASIDSQGRVIVHEPFSLNDEVLAHFIDWTSTYFLSGDEVLDSIVGNGENEPQRGGGG